jgi:acetyl-CoA synthetase
VTASLTGSASAFRAARDLLLQHRDDYDRAYAEFSWPELDSFNWRSTGSTRLGARRSRYGSSRMTVCSLSRSQLPLRLS